MGLGKSIANGEHAGDGRRADGAKADQQHASLPRAGAMSTGVGMNCESYRYQLSTVSSQPSAFSRRPASQTAASAFALRCIKLKAESCMFLKRDDPHLLIIA
jgi:hypothetical protein